MAMDRIGKQNQSMVDLTRMSEAYSCLLTGKCTKIANIHALLSLVQTRINVGAYSIKLTPMIEQELKRTTSILQEFML